MRHFWVHLQHVLKPFFVVILFFVELLFECCGNGIYYLWCKSRKEPFEWAHFMNFKSHKNYRE